MTEIEQLTLPLLGRIDLDHRTLDEITLVNGLHQHRHIPRFKLCLMCIQVVKVIPTLDERMLDDLPHAGGILDRIQTPERRHITVDERRHMEGTDHVLIGTEIDPRLSADRAVDLRKKRRRNLNETDASHIRRRREARHIPDDTTTECDEDIIPVEARLDRRRINLRDRIRVLMLLPRHQHQLMKLTEARTKRRTHLLEIQRCYMLIRHDQRTPLPKPQRLHRRSQPRETLLDIYRVGKSSLVHHI